MYRMWRREKMINLKVDQEISFKNWEEVEKELSEFGDPVYYWKEDGYVALFHDMFGEDRKPKIYSVLENEVKIKNDEGRKVSITRGLLKVILKQEKEKQQLKNHCWML